MSRLASPSDPHLTDAMAARKAVEEILFRKKKFLSGIWAPGSEAEGAIIKHYATVMFHWLKKSHAYKKDYPNYEIIPLEDTKPAQPEYAKLETRAMTLKPLQFMYEGEVYTIEFRRFTKDGPDHLKRRFGRNPQTKPFTEVNVVKGMGTGMSIYRTWTVGCWHRETFSTEVGRLNALRMALKGNSDKAFTAAVFDCYFNRFNIPDLSE